GQITGNSGSLSRWHRRDSLWDSPGFVPVFLYLLVDCRAPPNIHQGTRFWQNNRLTPRKINCHRFRSGKRSGKRVRSEKRVRFLFLSLNKKRNLAPLPPDSAQRFAGRWPANNPSTALSITCRMSRSLLTQGSQGRSMSRDVTPCTAAHTA